MIYDYLLAVEDRRNPFKTRFDKACVWLLRTVYGRRYWRELALKQAGLMKQWRMEARRLGYSVPPPHEIDASA